MKSQTSELHSRGFLCAEDLTSYGQMSTEDLIRMVDSDDAVERSAAVRLLARTTSAGDSLNHLFVERLTRETKLYTKLELCAALHSGGVASARLLIPLLGKIGKNQHKHPSAAVFRKSSYPLPRDIVARTLARMDPQILPMLVAVLRERPRDEVAEVIDAIGFMCFYAEVMPTDRLAALRALIDTFHENSNGELVQWKIARAFESFNHPDCLSLLSVIESTSSIASLRQEAQRSLELAVEQPSMW